MENREIAEKIYNHLNEKGAGLGNVSVMLIESVLDKVLPQANVIKSVCEHRNYRAGHSPFVPCICNDCGEEL